jgi:hypothetical protein
MSEIVGKRLVRHLERAGFVILKRPPGAGGAALGRGHDEDRNNIALVVFNHLVDRI